MFYMLFEGFILGLAIGVALTVVVWDWSSRSANDPAKAAEVTARFLSMPPAYVILGFAFGFLIIVGIPALLLFAMHRAMRHFDRLIDQHRRGQIGEERVVSLIQQALDGKWSAFLNVNLPGRGRGDIDVILVGPAGVYALEVKNLTGTYRNVGEQWEFQAGKRWRIARANPSRQAQDNAVRVAAFLKADSISQWVTPAVVWANPDAPLTVENPAVAVWKLDRLRDELGNLAQVDKVDATTRDRIADKLTKLCQSQADKQWLVENN